MNPIAFVHFVERCTPRHHFNQVILCQCHCPHFARSWIIHDNSVCVGYVVAYPQFSRLQEKNKSRVIYVDDIFVRRGYETCLFRLLKLFTKSAHELGLSSCSIEGVCRVSAYSTFLKHDNLLQRLGL